MSEEFINFGYEFIKKLKILSIKYEKLITYKQQNEIRSLLANLNKILINEPSIIYKILCNEKDLIENLFQTKKILILLNILDTNNIAKKLFSSDLKKAFEILFNNMDENDKEEIWKSIEKFLKNILE